MKIQDTLLDIVGFLILGLVNYKMFFVAGGLALSNYIVISSVGVVFVALTLKKIGNGVWDYFKKKYENEEDDK